jgi:hypothetical protein
MANQNLFDTVFGGSGSKLTGQSVCATLMTTVLIFSAVAVSRAADTGSLLQQADVDALMTVPVGGVPP